METRPPTFRDRAARASAPLLALVALGATTVVYFPVTRAYFFADDFVMQLQIVERGFAHFVLSVFGGHVLLVRNLAFFLSYLAFGFRPEPYYWTAFATHLLNVWLLFRVIRRFTDDAPLAALGATAWGVCPLCVGTIGWYAAYGHALVGTVLLAILDQVARHDTPSPARVGIWCLLLLAGTTCFGVGIGIALAFPLALPLLAPGALRDRRVRLLAVALPVGVVALFFAFHWLSAQLDPEARNEAATIRIGLSHLGPILTMVGHLVGVGIAGLVLGFGFVPAHYPGTASSWAIGGYVAVVLAALAAGDGRLRRRIAGLLLLALAAYALIGLGRANFYVALGLPLSVAVRQLRYQYAGLIPFVLIGCLALRRIATGFRFGSVASGLLLVAWLAGTTRVFRQSGWRVEQRDGFRHQVASAAQFIDAAIDGSAPGTDAYLVNSQLPPAMFGPAFLRIDFPGSVALFALLYPDDVVRDRHVHFVEPDAKLLAAIRAGNHPRLARLLVAPEEAPARPAGR